jgi:uncharacterized SAM-binding protein YcdF (DUF218 family)
VLLKIGPFLYVSNDNRTIITNMLIFPFIIITLLAIGILSAGSISPKSFQSCGRAKNTPIEVLVISLIIIGAVFIIIADTFGIISY